MWSDGYRQRERKTWIDRRADRQANRQTGGKSGGYPERQTGDTIKQIY